MSDEPGRKRGRWGASPADPSTSAIPPPPGMGHPTGQTVNVPPPPPAGGTPAAGSVVDVPPPPPGGGAGRGAPPGPPPGPPGPPPPPPRGGVMPPGPPGGYASAPRAAADGNPFAGASGSAMSAETAKSLAERAARAIQATLGLVGAAGADPSRYPGMPPGWGAGMSASQLQAAYHQHTRQSRRLYVGNIPVRSGVTADAVTKFFNDAMLASGAAVNPSAGDPVVTTTLNAEKGFAFVEFLAMEDAESALMFNDVPFSNTKLAVRRPKDYDPALNPLVVKRGGVDSSTAAQALANRQLIGAAPELPVGVVASKDGGEPVTLTLPPKIAPEWGRVPRRVPDGPNKLYAGGFDPLHGETQVRQILQAVGALKSFAPVPDANGKFSGHVFFEYADSRLTGIAQEALTGVLIDAGVNASAFLKPRGAKRRLVCRVANPTLAAKGKDTRDDVPKFTYAVPSSAAALLGEAAREGDDGNDDVSGNAETNVIWVYNAITAEHVKSSETTQAVESTIRLEAAKEADWDDAAVVSSRPATNGFLALTFQEGGGVGSADANRSAADAAAMCASRLNGRTFEGRELFARYAPP